ncbi:GNAT family N-acetyltransferase [Maritalea sp. S77]|uniref:GNAT family N-acetyltransferase n=1 Tax=Maritalea sp. S77 TaxID=3415125 RepID=UPI003C7BBD7F
MPQLSIRPAIRDDITTILALSIGGNAPGRTNIDDAEDAQNDDYQRAFDLIEQDPNNLFFIAELAGEKVGCMQINLLQGLAGRGRMRAQLEGVHIRADHRGKGLGGEMIEWAIAFAKSKGAGMVQLTSSKNRPDAHRFYERLGFDRSHEGFKLSL